MFSTVRSRLWFSYSVLSLIILGIVAFGVFISLVNNPIIYRQAADNLRTAVNTIDRDFQSISRSDITLLEEILDDNNKTTGIRFLLLKKDREVIYDTNAGNLPALTVNRLDKLNPLFEDDTRVRLSRDTNKRTWLYFTKKLQPGLFILAATRLPAFHFLTIFRDEFISPILYAGLAALFIAFLLSLVMSRWISRPLKQLSNSTLQFAQGSYQPIIPNGPDEVQTLAQAYNSMAETVQISRQSQKDLIANISHELKTPLTSIQGFSQAILDGTVETMDGVKTAAAVIHSESERMYRMVLDLLALARLEAGRDELRLQPIQLDQVIQSVVDQFQPLAKRSDIELKTSFSQGILMQGDEDRIRQVFTNLVDNAIRFTPASGKIIISSIVGKNEVLIQVKDTGSGIPSDQLPQIFERFFQASTHPQNIKRRGTGLGLAISREIIKAHGGTITVQSEINIGTTFTIKLPL